MRQAEDVIMDYLSQPDIIADLFNGYAFRGEQVIRPDMLKVVDNRGRRAGRQEERREVVLNMLSKNLFLEQIADNR